MCLSLDMKRIRTAHPVCTAAPPNLTPGVAALLWPLEKRRQALDRLTCPLYWVAPNEEIAQLKLVNAGLSSTVVCTHH